MIIKEIAIVFCLFCRHLAFQYLVENNGDFLTKWAYSWIWLKIPAIFGFFVKFSAKNIG